MAKLITWDADDGKIAIMMMKGFQNSIHLQVMMCKLCEIADEKDVETKVSVVMKQG